MALTRINNNSLSAVTAAGIPQYEGQVLQVRSFIDSSTDSTVSATAVATPLSLSITPSSTSSKVLIMMDFYGSGSSYSVPHASFYLYKNGAELLGRIWIPDTANYSFDVGSNGSIQYLDTPNTTSSTTYALYYKKESGTTAYYNRGGAASCTARSSITLMEIAG